jgi:hypothetical protein
MMNSIAAACWATMFSSSSSYSLALGVEDVQENAEEQIVHLEKGIRRRDRSVCRRNQPRVCEFLNRSSAPPLIAPEWI